MIDTVSRARVASPMNKYRRSLAWIWSRTRRATWRWRNNGRAESFRIHEAVPLPQSKWEAYHPPTDESTMPDSAVAGTGA
jgi:hypothetical protein